MFSQKKLMKWDPKVYLNVPSHEKDEAKEKNDIEWDQRRKKWYLHARHMSYMTDWEGLERWFPSPSPIPFTFRSRQVVEFHGLKVDTYLNGLYGRLMSFDNLTGCWNLILLNNGETKLTHPKNLKGIIEPEPDSHPQEQHVPKNKKKKKIHRENAPSKYSSSIDSSTRIAAGKTGNAKMAMMLRISEHMTIQQLKDECRYRGTVKGYSNKNKAWLLEALASCRKCVAKCQ